MTIIVSFIYDTGFYILGTTTNLMEKLMKHTLILVVGDGLQEFDVLNKMKT